MPIHIAMDKQSGLQHVAQKGKRNGADNLRCKTLHVGQLSQMARNFCEELPDEKNVVAHLHMLCFVTVLGLNQSCMSQVSG